jgi:uncharacterized NAD-dependent epimerase/dehydratase family protein
MQPASRRLVILAEGTLDFHHGKTATSLLRFEPDDVVAVIDSTNRGATTGQLLGIGGDIPIVGSVEETFSMQPDALVIGIAPFGGGLPAPWRREILAAVAQGMDVISGLHFMLSDDPEFAEAARAHAVRLTDVRRPPDDLEVATFAPHRPGSHVITFVGSDCAVGKMTAALEVRNAARAVGLSAGFVATGQTGIMLEGDGIAIDRVIGDFMSGAMERLVLRAAERFDWVFVEGQGSLLHPAYSGVTLALIHGSAPDAMILVHPPGLTAIDSYPVAIPSLTRLVQIYEEAAGWTKPARVAAIALNTRGMSEDDARAAIRAAHDETGLPATDPVRFGGGPLVTAVVELLVGREAAGEPAC